MELISPLQNQESLLSGVTDRKIGQLKADAESQGAKSDEELKKIAQQFESIFVNQLMKSMRDTLPKSGLVSSFSLDMYESMFDQEVAGEMAKNKSIGLAEVLYTQLSRLNEKSANEKTAAEDAGPPQSLLPDPGLKEIR